MSSFYGGASIYGNSNSGGGTFDYDELQNVPVKNLAGSESNPILLDGLDYGSYVLSGDYKFSINDTETSYLNKTSISVIKDTVTEEKIVTYQHIKNGMLYSRIITYREDGTYSISDISLANGSAPLIFIDDEEATAPAGSAPMITID